MVSQCITVNMQEPDITINSMEIGATSCITCNGPSACPTPCNVPCTGGTCPSSVVVTVTWGNTGNISGTFSPKANTTIASVPASVQVAAGSTSTCTFTVPGLARGPNNICVDSGTITIP